MLLLIAGFALYTLFVLANGYGSWGAHTWQDFALLVLGLTAVPYTALAVAAWLARGNHNAGRSILIGTVVVLVLNVTICLYVTFGTIGERAMGQVWVPYYQAGAALLAMATAFVLARRS